MTIFFIILYYFYNIIISYFYIYGFFLLLFSGVRVVQYILRFLYNFYYF